MGSRYNRLCEIHLHVCHPLLLCVYFDMFVSERREFMYVCMYNEHINLYVFGVCVVIVYACLWYMSIDCASVCLCVCVCVSMTVYMYGIHVTNVYVLVCVCETEGKR